MSRPPSHEIKRLKHKVWARALRSAWARATGRADAGWSELERSLLKACGIDGGLGRAQGIYGVATSGNDPRRLLRRVRADEWVGEIPQEARKVVRSIPGRDSGRRGAADARQAMYLEFDVDFVAAGETVCPGSSQWMATPLWVLAFQTPPDLFEMRRYIAVLMEELRLTTLAPGQVVRAPYGASAPEDAATRYANSLGMLVEAPSAHRISLLACLVAESYIVEKEDLLRIHSDYFSRAVELLLSDPLMQDIAADFSALVWNTIVTQHWNCLSYVHRSSIFSPFTRLHDG